MPWAGDAAEKILKSRQRAREQRHAETETRETIARDAAAYFARLADRLSADVEEFKARYEELSENGIGVNLAVTLRPASVEIFKNSLPSAFVTLTLRSEPPHVDCHTREVSVKMEPHDSDQRLEFSFTSNGQVVLDGATVEIASQRILAPVLEKF